MKYEHDNITYHIKQCHFTVFEGKINFTISVLLFYKLRLPNNFKYQRKPNKHNESYPKWCCQLLKHNSMDDMSHQVLNMTYRE